MKMRKGFVLGLVSVMMLAGCSGDTEPKTTTCSKQDGTYDDTVFVSEGDKVITQTEYDVYTFVDLALTEADVKNVDLMNELLANYKDMYVQAGITKGLEITYEVVDEQVVFKLVLDYTKTDMAELEAAKLVDDVESDYISLEATIKNFQDDSYTCE